jgi:hypothetical protein
MKRIPPRIILIVLLTACAVFLAARSQSSVRMHQAASLGERGFPDSAIRVYESILRKTSVERAHGRAAKDTNLEALVLLRMAELFNKKGMRSRAMQEYYRSLIISPTGKNATSLGPRTPEEYRDFAMTILEEKRGSEALACLDFFDDGKAAWDEYKAIARTIVIPAEPRDYYYALASAYIEGKLWSEARLYMTKRILHFVHPLDALDFAVTRYGSPQAREIREQVWGRDIFVTISDFEQEAHPVFSHWVSRSLPKAFAQGFQPDGFRGSAEYLQISYDASGGYDLWVVITNVPLNEPIGFDVGARLYCSSGNVVLNANVIYPAENKSALLNSSTVMPVREGWFEHSIAGLGALGRDFARTHSWRDRDMYVDKIVLDTRGTSGRISIDEIQLYVYEQ